MAPKSTTIILFLFYLFLIIGVIVSAWLFVIGQRVPICAPLPPSKEEWENFASVATLGVTSVSAIMAAVLSIRNLAVQARTAKDLVKVQQVLEKRIPAHGDLHAAAINYYRALAPLETGNFSFDDTEVAETKMKAVEGLVVYVSKEYTTEWRDFWQIARSMKEYVHAKIPSVEDRKKYWRDRGKELGNKLSQLEEHARELVS